MDQTAIQAGSPPVSSNGSAIKAGPPAPPVAAETPPPRRREPKHLVVRVLETIGDLRITVTLFALSLLLVFWGTWAQVDKGVWSVVGEYFRSAMVWVPLKVILMRTSDIGGAIPYPGGWTLGAALLINLLAAHVVHFRYNWKRAGVVIVHVGIIVMMVGELITGIYAVEGNMPITEGSSTNYVEHMAKPELAFVDTSDATQDHVAVIRKARLARGGLIQDERIPFDVVVDEFMVNSSIDDANPKRPNLADKGHGLLYIAKPLAEGAGVDTKQTVDIPAVYATLKDRKSGKVVGKYLFSSLFTLMPTAGPEWVKAEDGKTYQVSLRFQRTYKPYTFHLKQLDVNFWPNTNPPVPRDYSSYIHLTDPTRNEDRDARIYMNHPLRYAGETFYQSQADQAEHRTVLQVVHNPGWLTPYISCILVALGMIIHFGATLIRFLQKQDPERIALFIMMLGLFGIAGAMIAAAIKKGDAKKEGAE